MEFAEYGNLHESSAQRSIGRLCKFTIQAATALEHLEAKNVIHKSVKSFNCLVVAKDQVSPAVSQSACPGHSCSLFEINKTSRDQYNVELRFKGYYISAGQTSLLQVQ